MKESEFLKLNWKDALHGLAMAIGTPVIGVVLKVFESGSIDLDWQNLGHLAIAGGAAYLIKKLMQGETTPAQ